MLFHSNLSLLLAQKLLSEECKIIHRSCFLHCSTHLLCHCNWQFEFWCQDVPFGSWVLFILKTIRTVWWISGHLLCCCTLTLHSSGLHDKLTTITILTHTGFQGRLLIWWCLSVAVIHKVYTSQASCFYWPSLPACKCLFSSAYRTADCSPWSTEN